jgi:hypothetical protein
MAERSKSHLKQEFRDGERPTGTDFADLIDSFITKIDDAVNVDANSNLLIPGGVNLGNPTNGVSGTIRFNAGNVQVFDGGTWNNVGGNSGAFQPVQGGPSVAFGAGNVGIGTFAVAPTFKLEVALGNNTGTGDRAKFGNAVLANGNGTLASSAQFSHTDHSAGNNNFALRQGPDGDVIINSPTNQPISITNNRLSTRIFIAPTGQVVIGNNALIPGANANNILQVNSDAGKTLNGNVWAVISDGRYKKDVREFSDGLEKLMKVRPVKFKYDGLPIEAPADHEEVGIIGQELQEIFPYMISKNPLNQANPTDKKDDVLMYNGNALTYVMVNAIQELAAKVKELEEQLAEARGKK